MRFRYLKAAGAALLISPSFPQTAPLTPKETLCYNSEALSPRILTVRPMATFTDTPRPTIRTIPGLLVREGKQIKINQTRHDSLKTDFDKWRVLNAQIMHALCSPYQNFRLMLTNVFDQLTRLNFQALWSFIQNKSIPPNRCLISFQIILLPNNELLLRIENQAPGIHHTYLKGTLVSGSPRSDPIGTRNMDVMLSDIERYLINNNVKDAHISSLTGPSENSKEMHISASKRTVRNASVNDPVNGARLQFCIPSPFQSPFAEPFVLFESGWSIETTLTSKLADPLERALAFFDAYLGPSAPLQWPALPASKQEADPRAIWLAELQRMAYCLQHGRYVIDGQVLLLEPLAKRLDFFLSQMLGQTIVFVYGSDGTFIRLRYPTLSGLIQDLMKALGEEKLPLPDSQPTTEFSRHIFDAFIYHDILAPLVECLSNGTFPAAVSLQTLNTATASLQRRFESSGSTGFGSALALSRVRGNEIGYIAGKMHAATALPFDILLAQALASGPSIGAHIRNKLIELWAAKNMENIDPLNLLRLYLDRVDWPLALIALTTQMEGFHRHKEGQPLPPDISFNRLCTGILATISFDPAAITDPKTFAESTTQLTSWRSINRKLIAFMHQQLTRYYVLLQQYAAELADIFETLPAGCLSVIHPFPHDLFQELLFHRFANPALNKVGLDQLYADGLPDEYPWGNQSGLVSGLTLSRENSAAFNTLRASAENRRQFAADLKAYVVKQLRLFAKNYPASKGPISLHTSA